jgi:hypothetical protein
LTVYIIPHNVRYVKRDFRFFQIIFVGSGAGGDGGAGTSKKDGGRKRRPADAEYK